MQDSAKTVKPKQKHVTLYIATPDIFVEQTNIPNPYDLQDFMIMHATGENGENLDHMISYDDNGVDFRTAGDYVVYAMVMDLKGNVDSDYMIVHVLNPKEAKIYEKSGSFPGLGERLRASQNPRDDFQQNEDNQYLDPTLSPSEAIKVLEEREDKHDAHESLINSILMVILFAALAFVCWFLVDMFF